MFKRLLTVAVAAMVMTALVVAPAVTGKEGQASGQGQAKAEEAKSWYLIISPHTQAECLAALDAIAAQGAAAMEKYDWGCMANDHTGYARVHAASEEEALAMVPENMRAKARAIKLNKFTVEQVKSFHAESGGHQH